ncbi:Glyco hydro 47 domain containing protein [Trichuris trichiura]|uniref:alpha-1,2-Mannosidase n=1 Tax=Trichuris trichiura TaxID=36087 RepID=A0A077Z282_TRITR|nr:Glyco hydro 47 domain containing protein [Trichuris trichiura]
MRRDPVSLLEAGEWQAAAKPQLKLSLFRRWRLLHRTQQMLLFVFLMGVMAFGVLVVSLMEERPLSVIDEQGKQNVTKNVEASKELLRPKRMRFADPLGVAYFKLCLIGAALVLIRLIDFYKCGALYRSRKVSYPLFTYVSIGPRNDRQRAVRDSFLHAWKGYKAFAWGKDELDPVKNGSNVWFGLQLTLVDALDTALIMGLDDEYEEARNEIAKNFDVNVNRFVSLFEVTIRVLGGLLTVYHLTGDELFLEKAKQLGDRLLPAFKTSSGIPYSDVNLRSGKARNAPWTQFASLAEVTTIQLEFRELSRLTGNSTYEAAAFNVSTKVHNMRCNKYSGLCPMFVNIEKSKWNYATSTITLGARSDTYYEYLLKQWLQTGKRISWLRSDFAKSVRGMLKHLLRRSEPSKLLFAGEINAKGEFQPKMDHLACFISGAFALAVEHGFARELLHYAKDIGETCRAMYTSNPTGLGPEIAYFNQNPLVQHDLFPADEHSLLRPEAVEAWFYLYRLTNDSKYQDWGWDLLQAIEKHAKVASGYCSVASVMKIPTACRPKMESFLLSETFKYLYLLFDDEHSLFNLKQYNKRQQAVVNSFLHAWKGYKAFAWGEDELNPVANTSIPWFNMQLTLIESLDTLLIMGLKQVGSDVLCFKQLVFASPEFQEAREEIAANFTADVDKYFSFFEVTIRVLGGLLSAFYLSKDELFLQKARMLGDRLLPAFSTRSGFPLAEINPHLGTGKSYFWTSFVSLAELGTSQLEFRSLSRAVGNPAYEDAAFRVSLKLHEMSNMSIYPGLMPADIYEQEWVVSRYNFATYSVGARADSYYEYLLKQWLQTGKRINWLRDDFVAGMQAVLYYLARPSKDNRMLFLGEYKGRMYKPRMEHLTCFAAGSLALAAYNGLGQRFLRDAERIAAACRFMYAMTPTGLGPEFIRFGNDSNSMRRVGSPVYSLLRPEAVEAWFYLYRVTNDTKYQEWGWQMLQAIENHAKTPSGYCSIVDVYQVPTQCKPKMESFLLSETFKYLYLLFDDSHSLLPLKEYVFNTEAHPLPVF